MKKILLVLAVVALLAACNQQSAMSTPAAGKEGTAASAQNLPMPYTAWYTTDFEIGDAKYAQTVLTLWKDYDDNDFKDDDKFADTVSMDFPDAKHVKGKGSLNNGVKRFRESLKSALTVPTTYAVLKAKGTDDTWVVLWAKEVDEYKDGKKDSVWLNENWKFNKDGKIAYISQYAAGASLFNKK